MTVKNNIGDNVMAGIIDAFKTVKTVYDILTNDGSAKETVEAIRKMKNLKLLTANGSMMKVISNTIIEPLVIVSSDLKYVDITEKVLETNIDIFTGFYMQTFNLLTNVYKVDSSDAIRLLATNDSGFTSTAIKEVGDYLTTESADKHDYVKELIDGNITIGIEAVNTTKKNSKEITSKLTNDIKLSSMLTKNIELTIDINNVETFTDNTNNLSGNENKNIKIIIPITIKAKIVYIDTDSIINLMAPNSDDKKLWARLDEYRSGAITLTDLIFAGDLIRKYKKNKLKDTEDLMKYINNRTFSANSKALRAGVGFEKYYTILVASSDATRKIEKHLRGSVNKERYKNKLMEQTHSMMFSKVDTDYERVVIYTKDISGYSDTSFKALKKSGDKEDLSEIIKAMVSNRPVVL